MSEALHAPAFGEDISDIPIAVRARALTDWDALTGWIPAPDSNYLSIKQFLDSILARMEDQPDIDRSDPTTLLAVAAGISYELDQIYVRRESASEAN